MKLTYITHRYPAVSQAFIVREVQELRRRGFEISTVSVHRIPNDLLLSRDYVEEDANTLSLLPLNRARLLRANLVALARRPGSYFRTLASALREAPRGLRAKAAAAATFALAVVVWSHAVRNGSRHIHTHFAGTPTHVAALGARYGGGTWSLTVHGSAEFYNVDHYQLAARVRDANFVACISDFTRSQVLSLLDPAAWGKVHVVRCGVEPELFAYREPDGSTSRPFEILHVGRLMRVKAQGFLLDAVAELAGEGIDVRLTVVGEGPERAGLERLRSELGLDDRVELVGAVGQDDIREYYRRADLFCMSSLAEGVPVVLMEAMAMGVPVLAPRIMGIPELVEDGATGVLVPPARPDRLTEAIRGLVDDPERRAELARAARTRVEADYNLATEAEKLAGLLHAVAPGDGSA